MAIAFRSCRPRRTLARSLAALAVLGASSLAAAPLPPPAAWCEALLPVAAIPAALGRPVPGLARRTILAVPENDRQCARRYAIGNNPFGDELIVRVTPARDASGARGTLQRLRREAERGRVFGLSSPEGLGAGAVHFRRPDPLADHRMAFVVAFARGAHVVELTYHNVDNGKSDTFIQASAELEPIARGLLERWP
ncbi:MAG: hypothetical protein KatS3mg127_0444 [Silanimonas sp.]|nr:MAG: hypothetical protein KatS3mg127_0444 [Silanimonas sp.]